MTPDQLKKRTILIQGKDSKKSGGAISPTRRGSNYVDLSAEKTPTDIFDDYFEYDKEIAGMTPARLQFKDEDVELKDANELSDNIQQNNIVSPIIMDDNDFFEPKVEDLLPEIASSEANNASNNAVIAAAYIQCSFIMKDGKQCKRQAPKGSITCAKHKRFVSNNDE